MKIKLVGNLIYWLILAGLGLVAVFVAVSALNLPGGWKLFTVQSGSMQPAISVGSLVLVKPAGEYAVDEVITFKTGPAPTTHRINRIEAGVIITKGDANDTPDSEPVRPENIIGKVVLSLPYAGYPVTFAKSKEGFLLLIVIPATLIIYSEILNIKNEIKKLRRKYG
ncbi:signal peptidase I [Candidatus Beckwithbacteria bacterium CG_4_10_14_0_2_um_filter_47_25]|uniref:Signal peptidase I n=1 Tax=Candidatus Beckwithbacteria bacterium CG_4_10_14_0_2_um_filter_47_25 TaxID=1974493 RepID=A0A2M7W596_9BACT|nr:MAG: signal peptidase I [Candidatus Beckwithbacteria bacterium CG_4_10_14_0_2_um_filter_47_25]